MKNRLQSLLNLAERLGKENKGLKYPIWLLLFLLGAISRGIQGVKTLARRDIRRRVTAMAVAVCMVLTMLPAQTLAAQSAQGGLCEHHTTHTAQCGYSEGAAGSPCIHQHTENCNQATTDCIHEHTTDCYHANADISTDSGVKEPANCTHVCDEAIGCITQTLDCTHERGEHDELCGYTEEVKGNRCDFICEICNLADDAAKKILAVAESEVTSGTGWAIDIDGNLTISTADGMIDWVANGLAANKTTLKTATIESVVTEILDNAFQGCTALTNVSAPEVISIGNYAFHGCTALKSLYFPMTEEIGESAFEGCTVFMPEGDLAVVITISDGSTTQTAIGGTTLATAITASGLTVANIKTITVTAGEITTADWNWLNTTKASLTKLTEFTVSDTISTVDSLPAKRGIFPKSIVSITIPKLISIDGIQEFTDYTSLADVSLPDLVEIPQATFQGCTSLETVNLPKATTMEMNVFWGCTSLTDIVLPEMAMINMNAFRDCVKLESVDLPKATWLLLTCFQGCTSLESINLPEVTQIGASSFEACSTLKQADFPKATSIGDDAFKNCAALATLSLPGASPTVANVNAFTGCPATRALNLVDENGKALANTDLTKAQAEYKAVNDSAMSGEATGNNSWYGWTIEAPVETPECTITASAQTGGTITPSGSVAVVSGASQTFTITPNSNYSIAAVMVDGTNVGAVSSYTFSNVMANHTISATFNNNGGGGGGDGGDGGGSSSDSDTAEPPITPDKGNPSQGEATVTAPVDKDGNASITVTDKNISDAIAQAKKDAVQGQPITVSIQVETDQAATQITATLPKTVQETLISNKVEAVTIASNTVTLSFSQTAIQQMNSQAKADITITATQMDTGQLIGEAKALIGNRPMYDFTAIYGDSKIITDFGSNTVSIAIPYTLGKGETAGNIQAVYVDDNGKATVIADSSYDTDKQAVIFTTSHFSGYGIGYKPLFNDSANHWAKADIAFVASRGLLYGTGNNDFSPDSAMTRGMFATALGRLAEVDEMSGKNSSFVDVKADAYYAPYVAWAASKPIMDGTSTTTFAPNQAITRQEVAVVMANYAKAMGDTVPKAHEAVIFVDNDAIASWATEAVQQMQMAGILNGKNNNQFDPTGTVTRGEVAVMLHRYIEVVSDKTASTV